MQRLEDIGIHLLALRPSDALDILLVAALFYFLLVIVRGSTAIRLLRGLLIAVLLLLLLSQLLELPAFGSIIERLLPAVLISVPVIFQPELRRAFERLGRTGLFSGRGGATTTDWIADVAQASRRMADRRVGALIVVERLIGLDEFSDRGLRLDATASADLLMQIFVPHSPLHDGAVILRGQRILAARVVLPLGATSGAARGLGTRHLAAVSISRLTDAVAVVVSEETGLISLAHDGRLVRRLSETALAQRLRELCQSSSDQVRDHGWRDLLQDARRGIGLGGNSGTEPTQPAAVVVREPMRDHERRRWRRLVPRSGEFAMATVLGLVWWASAVSQARPIVERQLPLQGSSDSLSLIYTGLGDDEAAFRFDGGPLRVQVRGLREAVDAIRLDDLVVLAGLPDRQALLGRIEAPTRGRCRSRIACWRRGLRVVASRPERLAVGVGDRATGVRAVQIELGERLDPRLTAVRRTAQPAQVEVTGARAQLDKVDRVRAEVPPAELTQGEHVLEVPLQPVDVFGNPLQDLVLTPATVSVTLLLVRRGEPVTVAYKLRGAVAEGYEVYAIRVEPQSVQLEGEPEAIESVRAGDAFAPLVDVTGLTKDSVMQFPVDLPEGLQAVGGVDSITVTLLIRPQKGTRTMELNVQATLLGDGLLATLAPDTVQVVLEGPQPLLVDLQPDQVTAQVDLSGRRAGEYRLAPRIDLPPGLVVRSIVPEAIEVAIQRADGP